MPLIGQELPPNQFDASLLEPSGLYTLRDYQKEGVDFLTSRSSSLLADQPRLGKTIQACLAIEDFPALIVAPLATRPVWLEWLNRVWDEAIVYVCKGRDYNRELAAAADIVFCHYEILKDWQGFGHEWYNTVVFDEVHLLSNPRSLRTQSAQFVASKCKRVIGLSGTPMWNRLDGFYTILKMISRGGWGGFGDFARRYCSAYEGIYGMELKEPSNVEELQTRLGVLMLRRTWREVLDELPEVTRSVEVAEISRKERLELEKLAISSGGAEVGTVIGEAAHMRHVLSTRKVSPTVRLAKEFLDADESVVIWIWHKKVGAEIYSKLRRYGAVLITGDTRESNREDFLNQWRNSDSASPLIISLEIGQVGIDLSRARHAIFAEIDYTPAVMSQAEMRTFHPSRPMTVTYIVVDHGLEQRVVEILGSKCKEALETGVPCADTELDVLLSAFGENEEGDLNRLLEALR